MLNMFSWTVLLGPKPQPLTVAESPARMFDGWTFTVGGEQGRVVVVVDRTVVVVEVDVDVLVVLVLVVLLVLVVEVLLVVDDVTGLTNTAGEVPLTAALAVEVAVTVWLPEVRNVTPGENVCRPLSAATKV